MLGLLCVIILLLLFCMIPISLLSLFINLYFKDYGTSIKNFFKILKYRAITFLLTYFITILFDFLFYKKFSLWDNIYYLFTGNEKGLVKIFFWSFLFIIPLLFYILKIINHKIDNRIINLILNALIIIHTILISIGIIVFFFYSLSV